MSKPIRIAFFPQVAASPVLIAHGEGFFEKHGLAVQLTETPNSAHLIQGLIDGRYDFGVALADNFVAYQAGQHSVARERGQHLAIVTGLAMIRASLVVAPEISHVNQLSGRRIGVDAPQSGFALMLRGILQNAGLNVDEVQFVRSGSTRHRLEELLQLNIDATMLTPELAAVAKAAGFRDCGETQEEVGPCLGMAVGVNRQWAVRHHDVVARCVLAIQSAARWIAIEKNRPMAARTTATLLRISPDIACDEIERLCVSGDLITSGRFEFAALKRVLDLRRQFITPLLELDPDDIVLDVNSIDRPSTNGIV